MDIADIVEALMEMFDGEVFEADEQGESPPLFCSSEDRRDAYAQAMRQM
jgi:hypothetical protein